jgi:hypothetical protein
MLTFASYLFHIGPQERVEHHTLHRIIRRGDMALGVAAWMVYDGRLIVDN